MKVILLTSSKRASAAVHLEELIQSNHFSIVAVVFNEGIVLNKKKLYKRKFKKILKIGLGGAINGYRLRSWYKEAFNKYLKPTSIEDICAKNNLPLVFTPTINCDATKKAFKRYDPDIGLSLGNGYIACKIFSVPRYGMINIHHEMLPDYQNAQSVIWQIYNQSNRTGFTIHKIDKKIDTGEIIYKEEVPIEIRENLADTVAFNYAKLIQLSSKALVNILNDFEEYYKNATAQKTGKKYTTPSLKQFSVIKKNFNKLKDNV